MKRKRTTRRRNDIFRCRRMCAHRYILKRKKNTHTQNTYQKSLRLCHIIITWWKKTKWRKESSQVAVIRWKKARKHNTRRKKMKEKKQISTDAPKTSGISHCNCQMIYVQRSYCAQARACLYFCSHAHDISYHNNNINDIVEWFFSLAFVFRSSTQFHFNYKLGG